MRISAIFRPPEFADPDQQRTAGLLNGLLWLSLAGFLSLGLATMVLQPASAGRAWQAAVIVGAVSGVALVLLHRGRLVATGALFVAQLWLVVSVSAITGGGMETPAVQGYILVVVVAALLMGWPLGLLAGLVCVATQVAITFGEVNGLLPQFTGTRTPVTYLLVYTLVSGLVIVFVYYYTSQLSVALAAARRELAERRRVEQALRASEAGMRVFADATFEGIVISMNERIVQLNEQFARIMGYAPADLLGAPYGQLTAPNALPVVRQKVHEQSSEPYETVLVRRDGTRFPVEIRGRPYEYQGQPARLSVVRDLTEHKRAEAALRESQATLSTIIDSTADLIWSVDAEEFRLLTFNTSLRDYFLRWRGLTIQPGMTPDDVMPTPETAQQWRTFYQRALAEGPFTTEYVGIQGDITLRLAVSRLERDGAVFGVAVFGANITPLKETQHALSERLKEMTCLAEVRHALIRPFSLDEFCGQIVALLVPAMQFPELTVAVLDVNGRHYESAPLAPAPAEGLHADIIVRGQVAGRLAVYYRQPRPFLLPYEQGLVDGVSEELSVRMERHLDSQALRDREASLQEAQRLAHVGNSYWDSRTDATTWSDEMYRITGWDPALPGPSRTERARLYTPASFALIQEAVTNALATGEPYDLEVEIVRRDGVLRQAWARGEPVRDENGTIVGLSGTLQDITERKQAEAAVRESQELLSAAFQTSPDAVILSHAESGQFVAVNEQFLRLFGYSREEVNGKTALELGIYADRSRRAELVAALDQYGRYADFEVLSRRKNGETFYALFSASKLTRPDGVLFLTIIHDITERKLAEQQLLKLNQLYSILTRTNQALVRARDQQALFDQVCRIATEDGWLDMAWVGLVDLDTHRVRPVAAGGTYGHFFDDISVSIDDIPEGRGPTGRAIRAGQHIICRDIEHDPQVGLWRDAALALGYRASAAFPLMQGSAIIGALTVCAPQVGWFSDSEVALLDELADEISYALDALRHEQQRQRAELELRQAYERTIEGWSQAMDLRDKETEGHTQRVTELVLKLAQAAGLTGEQMVQVRRGALLHDIGKLGVPDGILLKAGPLTDKEWVEMRKHPTYAYQLLAPIAYLRPALDIPYCHHEKWDGTGYPRGLKYEEIPLVARLFAVIDVWDALGSDRPYRLAWPRGKVMEHIRSLAGTHFDPEAVRLFMDMLANDPA